MTLNRFTRATLLLATLPAVGCGGAGLMDAPLPSAGAADAYWTLRLTDHAINLSVTAPTNTMQLEATAVTADGQPVPGVTAAPTYTVLAPDQLSISPSGVLTALAPGRNLLVRATWQYDGLTHTDSAYVTVTDTAPTVPLATLSIQPPPGDSAKWSLTYMGSPIPWMKQLGIVVTDTTGQSMPVATFLNGYAEGLAVAFVSSKPQIAVVMPGMLVAQSGRRGTTMVTASTYAYGVRRTDSLAVTIGLPTQGLVTIANASAEPGALPVAAPAVLTVGVGAIVSWSNQSSAPVSIVFDTPDAATDGSAAVTNGEVSILGLGGSGNISTVETTGAMQGRQFRAAGTYPYRDAHGRLLGTIVVRAD